ncbi:hypothetical protein [cf. Phormidesmis sp. LEGE 11477]|uniref:hypothetical protein n=1 Tax=cf. Phormidesmis sp. LEGE 11477 TaxID=1828680 RepID=UPI00187F4F7A|nr:hypothetical protein [cf. Phormidesmis sp. LEGE 11477]MBE9063421.1 hypothetical protein [cf. Phormidesmis sp. LEGE 11477]
MPLAGTAVAAATFESCTEIKSQSSQFWLSDRPPAYLLRQEVIASIQLLSSARTAGELSSPECALSVGLFSGRCLSVVLLRSDRPIFSAI